MKPDADVEYDDAGETDEGARRRKRTYAYLTLWGISVDLATVPVPLTSEVAIPSLDAVIGRAKALALCSLKGQGLTQFEVFAFADAYEVWDHLSIAENDYILDPDPSSDADTNNAWRYEGVKVLEWCLGLVPHLGFPDKAGDSGAAIKICIEDLCVGSRNVAALRPVKDLLDAADVARCLHVVAQAVQHSGAAMPSGLHHGVAFERHTAFTWLLALPG